MADTEATPYTRRPAPRRAPANHTQWREGSAPPRPPARPAPPLPPRARSLARARSSPARRPPLPPAAFRGVYKHKRHAEGPRGPRRRRPPRPVPASRSLPAGCERHREPPKPGFGVQRGEWGDGRAAQAADQRPACGGRGTTPARAPEAPGSRGGGEKAAVWRSPRPSGKRALAGSWQVEAGESRAHFRPAPRRAAGAGDSRFSSRFRSRPSAGTSGGSGPSRLRTSWSSRTLARGRRGSQVQPAGQRGECQRFAGGGIGAEGQGSPSLPGPRDVLDARWLCFVSL